MRFYNLGHKTFETDFSSIGGTLSVVQDSGELTKACLKYAVEEVFQNDGHQSYRAETLHQD